MDTSQAFGNPLIRGLVSASQKSRVHQGLKTRSAEIERLVARVKENDTEAFSALYEIFITPLYRYVYYRVKNHDVEDLLEIIFLKIWQHIGQYRSGESSFGAWAYRIAHNVVIDYYRQNSNGQVSSLHDNIADENKESRSSHRIVQKLNHETLKQALLRMKDNYQQILILKFFNDLENDEIEKMLGKSQNAIRILLFRALRALKAELFAMGITEWDT